MMNPHAQLDMKGLDPIPVQKTLLIVNTFVVNTVTFANKFLAHCEVKLCLLRRTLEKLEIQMNLLEGKLNSIDWLKEPSPQARPAPAPAANAQPANTAANPA